MACFLTITRSEDDLALDQAIYDPLTNKIYGVRGQWLFKFNADSAALEDKLRYKENLIGIGTLTVIAGSIYVTAAIDPVMQIFTPTATKDLDIYIVDTATFSVTGRFNLGFINYGGGTLTTVGFLSGFKYLINDGTRVAFWTGSDGVQSVDPINIPGRTRHSWQWINDWCYDSFNNVFWIASTADQSVTSMDPNPIDNNHAFSNGVNNDLFGVTYNSLTNKVYAARGSQFIFMANAADSVPGFNPFNLTSLDTGQVNCNAFRIKSVNALPSNPFNGKVLIPTWGDDSVIVWDPTTDTVASVKTGFTAPFDIVNTSIKSFALQTSPTGLKEILP